MRVSIHITTHCCSTHLQHAASPQMGISQLLYLKVTFNICYSSSFSWRGMLISLISRAELWLLVAALQVLSWLVWGNTWWELDTHAFSFLKLDANATATANCGYKLATKYCSLWKVERRLEQDECFVSRMKTVAAGGVLGASIKANHINRKSNRSVFWLKWKASVFFEASAQL